MIINRIYEKSSVAVACFLPGWAKDLSAPLYSRWLAMGRTTGIRFRAEEGRHNSHISGFHGSDDSYIMTVCTMARGNRRFGGTYCLHIQGPNCYPQDRRMVFRNVVTTTERIFYFFTTLRPTSVRKAVRARNWPQPSLISVKNEWIYTTITQHIFMVLRLGTRTLPFFNLSRCIGWMPTCPLCHLVAQAIGCARMAVIS